MGTGILAEHFELLADAPKGVKKLRELILDLAVRGDLVAQEPQDEPAFRLTEALSHKLVSLVKEGRIRRPKTLPSVHQTELPCAVPDGWAVERLANLVSGLQNGLSKRRGSTGVNTAVLRLADIVDGQLSDTNLREIVLTAEEVDKYHVSKGDILIIRVNGSADLVGRFIPCSVERNWTYCDHMIRMRFLADFLDQRYLCLAANATGGRRHIVGKTVTTAGQKTVNQTGIGTLPVLVPPLAEQRRIVAKVDELMALCDELDERQGKRNEVRIQACTASHAALTTATTPTQFARHWTRIRNHFNLLYDTPQNVKELRQLILQLAVQGKLVEQDPGDEPAEALLAKCERERKRLADANRIGVKRRLRDVGSDEQEFDAPPGWRWARINHFCDHRLGKMLDKAKNKGTPYPYLRNTNVQWLAFDMSDVKEMRFENDELEEFEVRPGDLMVCEGGHPGRCAIWHGQVQPMMFQKAIHRIRPLAEIKSRFIQIRLWCDFNRGHLSQYSTGATIKHFTGKELARYAICLPPLAEQQRIVARVDQLMALCDELESNLTQSQADAEKLMEAVVHRLLNGAVLKSSTAP